MNLSPKAPNVTVVLIALILLSIGSFAVTLGPGAFTRSVPVQFDWDHAKGFNAISVKHPLPLPFYDTLLSLQARSPIASLFRKRRWRSAKGTLSVRVCLYYVVLGLDRQSTDASEIIDPETTPLMHAAEEGNTAEVERLIAQGADVNAQDQRGWTALMHAAMEDRATETKLLLDAGANPNLKGRDGRTAMAWSAQNCALDVVRVFVRRGVSFNTYDGGCPGLPRALSVGRSPQ